MYRSPPLNRSHRSQRPLRATVALGAVTALVAVTLAASAEIDVPAECTQDVPGVVNTPSVVQTSRANWSAWYESEPDQSLAAIAYRDPTNLTTEGSATRDLVAPAEAQDTGVGVSVQNVCELDPSHGVMAVRYDGRTQIAGTANAMVVLHDELDVVVGADSMLTYQLWPEDGASAHAAVDLVYTDADGDNERVLTADVGRVDVEGRPNTAKEHGSTLRAKEWNLVGMHLGELAGKTITKVLLDIDIPTIEADVRVTGLVDNITISTAVVDNNSTTWQFSDTNTDPVNANDGRTVWTKPEYDDSSWKVGRGRFGVAQAAETGGGNTIDTEMAPLIDGSSDPVISAYFFRTDFTLSHSQIDGMAGLYGSISYAHSVTLHLNGERFTGWGDTMLTENSAIQNRNGANGPLREFFSIPASMLRAGENTIAVEVHQRNDTDSAVVFHLPALVATPDYLPFEFSTDDLKRRFSSDIRPEGPQGQDYIVAMLEGFDDLMSNSPDVLAPNSELGNTEGVMATNDLKVIEVNNTANDQQRNRALTDGYGDAYLAMADGLGPLEDLYTEAMQNGELPKTEALLSGRIEENIGDHEPAKSAYNYKRPYVRLKFESDGGHLTKVDVDSRYNDLVENGSFPSGHANHGYSQGITLATLVPQLAPQILTRTSEYGNSRLVLAFHYPLDVMGSRMVGQRVAQQRWSDPEFRSLLWQAKAEIQAVLAHRCETPTVEACLTELGRHGMGLSRLDEDLDVFTERLTYGFDKVGDGGQPIVLPVGAADLLRTTYPELSVAQREMVLEVTALDSGFALGTAGDNGTSWLRINLAAAMAATVSVNPGGTLTVNGQESVRP